MVWVDDSTEGESQPWNVYQQIRKSSCHSYSIISSFQCHYIQYSQIDQIKVCLEAAYLLSQLQPIDLDGQMASLYFILAKSLSFDVTFACSFP